MTRPPRVLDGAAVLQVADLDGSAPTGVADGERQQFAALAIARYDSDPGYYLFYCDADWHVVADTYHDSLEEARARAGLYFGDVEFVEPGV